MISRQTLRSLQVRGMSLIELLTVIAIISILMVLSSGAFHNFSRSIELTNGTQSVNDALNFARQLATSRNEYAQVRFFTPTAADDPGKGHFTAVAVYRADSPFYTNNFTQLFALDRIRQEGQIVRLPQSCAMISNATYSPLITALASDPNRSGTTTLPSGQTYNWVGFYFKPDGSTDIPSTSTTNIVSLCALQPYKVANKLPANYTILNLDRLDGRLQLVRP